MSVKIFIVYDSKTLQLDSAFFSFQKALDYVQTATDLPDLKITDIRVQK